MQVPYVFDHLAFRCYFRELARTLNLTLRSRNRPFWTCWTKEDWLVRYSANNIDDCRSVSDRFFLARVCESNWVDMSSCTGSSRVWWRNVTRTLPGMFWLEARLTTGQPGTCNCRLYARKQVKCYLENIGMMMFPPCHVSKLKKFSWRWSVMKVKLIGFLHIWIKFFIIFLSH